MPYDPAGDYTVVSGDTLSNVARDRLIDGTTLDQMLVALHRANPTAFIDNNMNRLRTGAILKMPSADEISSVSRSEARQEVRIQREAFNDYKARLAGDIASRAASPDVETSGSTRAIDVQAPTNQQNRDRLELSNANTAGSGDLAAQLQKKEETIAATQHELQEAKERVDQLEGIVDDLKKLIALKDKELATRTQSQPSAPTPAPAQESESPVVATVEPVQEPTPPEQITPPPQEEPAPPPEEAAQPSPPPPQIDDEIEEQRKRDAEEEGDPLLALLTDPQTLGIGALIIVLLGVFLGFRSWQRRRADGGLETLSQDTSMFPSEATSIFGDNGGQSVDTSASSVIHTDFSQTGLSIDTNEGVDPVAEADVYMAYGRDTQAEEILN
ncbi:MAG: hypothetical protein LBR05_04770, partial [Azoarcus sp.]|nr:hypothetical protein [Azoarcus sp.]